MSDGERSQEVETMTTSDTSLTKGALRLTTAPLVTKDDLDLIKRTVANGATDAELRLFLFDCKRRGVHPLDKLIHFTKRGGKYTPVTSIDFMRSQAAMTGEMAGSDDALFDDFDQAHVPKWATVKVYRLTQGQRFPYTATARWSEYCPEPGPNGKGDVMWRKMPRTMLGKCAEALALRKAFPQQLSGLYVKEEMDQIDSAPLPNLPSETRGEDEGPDLGADLPEGAVRIVNVNKTSTRNPNVSKYTLTVQGGPDWPANQTTVSTVNAKLAADAQRYVDERATVKLTTKKTQYGYDVIAIVRVEPEIQLHADEGEAVDPPPPLTADDIPF